MKGRYPYFVSLNHLCGGALIAPDIVLSAGHCKGRNHVYARVGAYSFRHDDENVRGYYYELIRIIQQVRHPAFQWLGDDEFVHDFLLLKLKHPSAQPTLRLNPHLHVPPPNGPVVAMGLGNTHPDDGDSRASVLRHVTLNALPNELCEESVAPARNLTYAHRIHPSMLCTTGGPNNARDACAYDSGSPIVLPGDALDGTDDVLVALVSWGEACADPDFPGVNARISDAYDWIRATLCALSAYPPADLCPRDSDDDDTIVVHAARQRWNASDSTLGAMVVGVGLLLLVVLSGRRRCWGGGGGKELEAERWANMATTPLKKAVRSWTKLRSYDAMAEMEPLHHHSHYEDPQSSSPLPI